MSEAQILLDGEKPFVSISVIVWQIQGVSENIYFSSNMFLSAFFFLLRVQEVLVRPARSPDLTPLDKLWSCYLMTHQSL